MDIPGHGYVEGEWDLRDGIQSYLGNVEFNGKRVLEIGTADGFLSIHMEKQGADVVAYDLSEDFSWDIVPFSRYDYCHIISNWKTHIKKLNNAFWLSHRANRSKAKMVYGSVYTIPKEIGFVYISTFGSVLLHVRDPFLALQKVLNLTKETVIITEVCSRYCLLHNLFGKIGKSYLTFVPNFKKCEPQETWWSFNPEIVKKFIGILGFEKTEVKHHFQKFKGRKVRLFTIVGHRT